MFDRLNAQGCSNMSLAGAGASDCHDIVGAIDKSAAVQLPDKRLVHLARCKVISSKVLIGWEPRGLDLVSDGSNLAFGHLGFEQLRQNRHGGLEGGSTLFDQFANGLGPKCILGRTS
jgi:hypothetical protein